MIYTAKEIRRIINGLPGNATVDFSDEGYTILPRDVKTPRHRKVDIDKARYFRYEHQPNMSYEQIGKIFGVSRQAVEQFFKNNNIQKEG